MSLRGRGGNGNGDEPGEGRIHATITIERPREEVWRFWRRLENLPRVLEGLESVEEIGEGRSRWRARVPGRKEPLEWEAEIVDEREGERLAWASLPGSDVDSEGVVEFADATGGATEVRLAVRFDPGGPAGAVLRRVGPVSRMLLQEQLRRLKRILEG